MASPKATMTTALLLEKVLESAGRFTLEEIEKLKVIIQEIAKGEFKLGESGPDPQWRVVNLEDQDAAYWVVMQFINEEDNWKY